MNAAERAAVVNILRAVLPPGDPATDALADARAVAGALAGGGISGRQREVLQLVADGLTEEQAARRLGIAHATVKAHKATAFKALQATSAAHAVAIGFRRGLLK